MLTIECGVLNKIWRHHPIFFKHVFLWCLLLDPHLTTSIEYSLGLIKKCNWITLAYIMQSSIWGLWNWCWVKTVKIWFCSEERVSRWSWVFWKWGFHHTYAWYQLQWTYLSKFMNGLHKWHDFPWLKNRECATHVSNGCSNIVSSMLDMFGLSYRNHLHISSWS